MTSQHTTALLIYYASFLALPFVVWLVLRIFKHKSRMALATDLLMLLLGLAFVWARFIEPQMLRTQETVIEQTGIQADVVLISDVHMGPYKGARYLQRVVDRVNTLGADFNVIAGDFIYKIKPKDLASTLSPLRHFNRPTYIVLGNHDAEVSRVGATLQALGLILIEEQVIDMGSYQLTGVGDQWGRPVKPTQHIPTKPTIMLVHNPDSTSAFDATQINLVLAGHTHCGQMRIPYLYQKMIPTAFGHDCGLEQVQVPSGTIPVYITAGTGETGLPMRLFNPPTVDLLHIRP